MGDLIGNYENDRAKSHQEREELLYGLLECWARVGDMRLGQFLVNALSKHIAKTAVRTPAQDSSDAAFRENIMFMMEDQVILAALRQYVREYYPLPGEVAKSS